MQDCGCHKHRRAFRQFKYSNVKKNEAIVEDLENEK